MKAIFAHDHKFIKKEEKIYTSGTLNSNIWKRYLKNFEEILVLGRIIEEETSKIKKIEESSLEKVKFYNVPDLCTLKGMFFEKQKAKKIIIEKVKEVEVVIVRLPSEIGNLVYDVATELNKKVIIELVACPWDALWNIGTLKGKIYAFISKYKTAKRVLKAQNVIYVTDKFLQKRYPTKGKSIGCSDVELIRDIKESKRNYSLNNRTLNIGLIGNINNKLKGIDAAIKAVSILKKKYDIKLKILGNGDKFRYKNLINKLNIEKNVEFMGTLPSGKPVYEWLDKIDIYIQPSYQEGLPRAVIEAMYRECPIVVFDTGGMSELISSNFVCKKKNAIELSKKIEELILNTDIREIEGKNNYKKSLEYRKDKLENKRFSFLEQVKKEN